MVMVSFRADSKEHAPHDVLELLRLKLKFARTLAQGLRLVDKKLNLLTALKYFFCG